MSVRLETDRLRVSPYDEMTSPDVTATVAAIVPLGVTSSKAPSSSRHGHLGNSINLPRYAVRERRECGEAPFVPFCSS
jgi:RNA binding exosome subunit